MRSPTLGRSKRSTRMGFHPSAMALVIAAPIVVFGCGGGSASSSAPVSSPSAVALDAAVIGQYNLVLTSTNGRGTTNIYTDFTQTGKTFAGAANTLVCPSNDLSQCLNDDAPGISITPSGTVNGTKVTLTISSPSAAGADTLTMVGTATGTNLAGTYTDSLGDAGTWTASAAIHPVAPPPGVYDYSGTFNSTLNPLLIAPTILLELGQDASSHVSSNLAGRATIMHSLCISSLALSGQAIGDAFSLTDAASRVSIIALPTVPTGNSFTFSYKFEPTAASCAGDFGSGVLTIITSPWDY
jgi:hypothetical protein